MENDLETILGELSTERMLYSYGIGVDCHSKFYAACLLIRDENNEREAMRYEFTFTVHPEEIKEAKQKLLKLLKNHNIVLDENDFHYTCESTPYLESRFGVHRPPKQLKFSQFPNKLLYLIIVY